MQLSTLPELEENQTSVILHPGTKLDANQSAIDQNGG
jgi:hypothetical protein